MGMSAWARRLLVLRRGKKFLFKLLQGNFGLASTDFVRREPQAKTEDLSFLSSAGQQPIGHIGEVSEGVSAYLTALFTRQAWFLWFFDRVATFGRDIWRGARDVWDAGHGYRGRNSRGWCRWSGSSFWFGEDSGVICGSGVENGGRFRRGGTRPAGVDDGRGNGRGRRGLGLDRTRQSQHTYTHTHTHTHTHTFVKS